MIPKIFTTISSVITIGFGIWHFFVPGIWNWYSYIYPEAAELILAVRAINLFFSLTLVLIGTADIILIYWNFKNTFSVVLMLSVSSILWLTRVIVQIIYPQGSLNPLIQYSMLSTFILVTSLYIISIFLIVFPKSQNDNVT
jgi:hypothetical protein